MITAQLRRLAERFPVDEKLLVTSGAGPAQDAVTLRDRLAAEGTPWIGFREATVADLARRAAAPRMAEEGVRYLDSIVKLFLVRELVEEHLLDAPDGYFADLEPTAAVSRTARDMLDALRGAGLGPDDLDPAAFVSREKGAALRRLFAAYHERLAAGGWVDDAGVVRRALDAIDEGRVRPVPVLCVLGDMRITALQARLLERWPAERRLLLGWAGDVGIEPGSHRARVRLEGFTAALAADGGEGPHPAGRLFRRDGARDGPEERVSLALAVGAENEVREVLRRVRDGGLSLDRVELVYTDGERYRDLARSEAEHLDLDCTFAEGLPVHLTRPGQALRLFYDWILEDFDDRVLRRLLRSGLLDLRRADAPVSELLPSQAAALLREAQIGSGRRRYGEALDRLRRRLELRREDREAEGRATEAIDRRLGLLEALEGLVHPAEGLLWRLAPGPGEVAMAEVARSSLAFLERLVPRHGELEPSAHESLARRLHEVAEEVDAVLPRPRAVRLLRDEVEQHPISRSGPRPGRLHVAPLGSGGLAGRELTVVVGLDEGSFPGTGLEDPFLLDRERRRLSPALPLRGREPTERAYDLARTLGEASGQVLLTASVLEVADDRELFPASAFLRAYRVAAGAPRAGVEACLEALEPPASFVPEAGTELEETGAWLLSRGRPGYAAAVRRERPSLAGGREAVRARASDDFTVWDGRVPAAQGREDPRSTGEVVSASRLETLVESPHRYFLRYVLGLEPVEELAREPGQWLDPLERGRLLHQFFRQFMEELRRRGERPDADRHGELAEEVLGRLIDGWRERIPPPSDGALRRQVREIRRTARTFLRDESARAEEAEGVGFEVRFGFGDAGGGPGSPEPAAVEVGPAGTLRLRGSIDRVDRLPDGAHRVWDYKTGSPARYSRADPFAGGRLQWLLYALALERLLRQDGTDARIATSGYVFPGARGHGQRFAYRIEPERVERAGEILARHLDLVRAGLFPHAPDRDACRWCDFELACGDADQRARQTESMLSALDEGAGGPARALASWRDG